jgi:hypothetical protein
MYLKEIQNALLNKTLRPVSILTLKTSKKVIEVQHYKLWGRVVCQVVLKI